MTRNYLVRCSYVPLLMEIDNNIGWGLFVSIIIAAVFIVRAVLVSSKIV
jgi:hypothetical protein